MLKDHYTNWEDRCERKVKEAKKGIEDANTIIKLDTDLRTELMREFPDDTIEATLQMGSIVTWLIAAHLYLDPDAPESTTKRIVAWACHLGFKSMKRNIHQGTGLFFWKGQREIAVVNGEDYTEELYIENAHDFGCKLVKEEYTATRFKAECPEGIPVEMVQEGEIDG